MPPPRQKRPPAGQPVPGAGTISAHRDALRRSSGAAGQKPPERGLKNSPRRSRRLCAGCAHGGRAAMGGVWFREAPHWAARQDRGHTRRKNSPRRRPGAVRRLRPWESGGHHVRGGVWKAPHWAPAGAEGTPGAKTAPAGAGGCLDAGYGCYLPRAIRVIWMHRVGSTARPRIMPS